MLTDGFRGDIEYFLQKVKNKENFAFTRSGDGELSIMSNKYIDITKKANGEFKFNPEDETDHFYRKELIRSHRFSHESYYVGISCPCCENYQKVNWMRETVGTKNLTWANLFVNGNYEYFLENFIPEFKDRQMFIVCNKKADTSMLPFEVEKKFPIGTNAYKDDYKLVDEIKLYIENNNIKDAIFILCAGPFGNILAHKLFDRNKENTYIDCGSVFDPIMGLGKTRGYHNPGYPTRKKICIW